MSSAPPVRDPIARRGDFSWFTPIQVRWGDLDPFNHVNNVVYYRYFEIVVVTFLAREARVDLTDFPVKPFAAESRCVFTKPIDLSGFGPMGVMIDGAIAVDRLGTSSVTYGLGLFLPGEDEAAAQGSWVHVYVDRETQRPVPIPDDIRAALEKVQRG